MNKPRIKYNDEEQQYFIEGKDQPYQRWKDADEDAECSTCKGTSWQRIWFPDGHKTDEWHLIGDCCVEEVDE